MLFQCFGLEWIVGVIDEGFIRFRYEMKVQQSIAGLIVIAGLINAY